MTNLFNSDPNTPVTPDPTKQYFEELVGDGKKFKSPEDLARAKLESDRFIEQLKGEMAGLRQDLSTRLTLEQMMDKIAATPKAPNPEPVNNQSPSNGEGGVKLTTEEDIARIVEQRLSEAEKLRNQEANLNQVRQLLSEKYGPDFATHLKQAATNLGVGEDFLNNLAKEQPKAFLRLVEAEAPKQQSPAASGLFTPPKGQNTPVNGTGFSPSGDRKQSYYDSIKQKDPATYWSASVQNQLHKDAIRLGEAFFDTE